MAKKNKELKKALKMCTVKETRKDDNTNYDFIINDFTPSSLNLPDKYYTAKMSCHPEVKYLSESDIIIIDPTVKKVRESGIYVFEFKGVVMVRQFQILPFGIEGDKRPFVRSVGSTWEEKYPESEVNILGAVIGKHVELFPNLYKNNSMYRAYGG